MLELCKYDFVYVYHVSYIFKQQNLTYLKNSTPEKL
jgi:hypothetical protein